MTEIQKCTKCGNSVPSHFFYGDVCIPCAVNQGAKAEPVLHNDDYEVIEDVGCSGGGCTL